MTTHDLPGPAAWSLSRLVRVAALLIVALASACGSSGSTRQARVAEVRGDFERAYELYLKAAEASPSSGQAASGLARVGPKAAAAWERKARAAQGRGDDASAWRFYMLALEARPDHSVAAEGARALERRNSVAVAQARAEWERDGMAALLRSPASGSADVVKATTGPPTGTISDQFASAAAPGAEEPPVAVVESKRPAPAADREGPVEPLGPDAETPAADAARSTDVSAAPEPRRAEARMFESVAMISRRDRHFRRSADIGDGIELTLRGIDEDDNVAVDVRVGDRLTLRERRWRPNDALRIRGRSGREYEVVLLTIFERTDTIRFGVARVRQE